MNNKDCFIVDGVNDGCPTSKLPVMESLVVEMKLMRFQKEMGWMMFHKSLMTIMFWKQIPEIRYQNKLNKWICEFGVSCYPYKPTPDGASNQPVFGLAAKIYLQGHYEQ